MKRSIEAAARPTRTKTPTTAPVFRKKPDELEELSVFSEGFEPTEVIVVPNAGWLVVVVRNVVDGACDDSVDVDGVGVTKTVLLNVLVEITVSVLGVTGVALGLEV